MIGRALVMAVAFAGVAAGRARAESDTTTPAPAGWELLPKAANLRPRRGDPRHPQTIIRYVVADRGYRSRIDGGLGGEVGVWRYTGADDAWSVGLDAYAAFFAQFDLQHRADLIGFDGQYGFPLVARWGAWTTHVAFRHWSSHLGDETAERTGWTRLDYRREELAGGLSWQSRAWGLHVFGEFGYGLDLGERTGPQRQRPGRLQFGADWEPRAGAWGRWPIVLGCNVQCREEVDWQPTVHLELGGMFYSTRLGREIRVTTGWYSGHSVLLQFHDRREQWWSVGARIDF